MPPIRTLTTPNDWGPPTVTRTRLSRSGLGARLIVRGNPFSFTADWLTPCVPFLSLAAGLAAYYPMTRDVINTLTITVLNGDLCVFAGNRTSGPPDYRVLPGNTRQYQLPPNTYDWTWQANGAQTDAVVTLSNL